MKKFTNLPKEKWIEIKLRNRLSKRRYAVSDHGRVASFTKELSEDGKLLSLYAPSYRLQKVNILFQDGKRGFPVHKLVANHFLKKPEKDQTFVVHLDKNLHNNHFSNLRWVSFDEATRHFTGKDMKHEKIKFGAKEEYKLVKVPGMKKKYAITNTGRLISFSNNIETGSELSLNIHPQGYKIWRFRQNGASTHYLIHRLVALYFLKKPSKLHEYVIHLDHSKTNNHVKNLQWVTYDEQRTHSAQSEASRANALRLSQNSRLTGKGKKLTDVKVRQIKTLLFSPKRKLTMVQIAEKYGITTMQLYRIKNGENWGWVKLDKGQEAPLAETPLAKKVKKPASKPSVPAKKATKKAAAKKLKKAAPTKPLKKAASKRSVKK